MYILHVDLFSSVTGTDANSFALGSVKLLVQFCLQKALAFALVKRWKSSTNSQMFT